MPDRRQLKQTDGPFEGLVGDPGVDLGGSDLFMAEGLLDQVQIAGLLIQPSGEGVP